MSILPRQPLTLYTYPLSGHAHRVELLLRMLDLPFDKIEVNLRAGDQKQTPYLAKNPFGQVPVLDDGGTMIWDSAAILVYLATKYDDGRFLPHDPVGAAEVQQWLAVAAGPIYNGPAAARRYVLSKRPSDIEQAHAIARSLFEVMDAFLAKREYLAVDRLTIADLAAYSYVAHAPEGGVALTPYPQLQAWLRRVENAPGFVPMPGSKIGLLAD
jgi:glutathione S-transferase